MIIQELGEIQESSVLFKLSSSKYHSSMLQMLCAIFFFFET